MPSNEILSRNRLLIACESYFALAARAGVIMDGQRRGCFVLSCFTVVELYPRLTLPCLFSHPGTRGPFVLGRYAQSVTWHCLARLHHASVLLCRGHLQQAGHAQMRLSLSGTPCVGMRE